MTFKKKKYKNQADLGFRAQSKHLRLVTAAQMCVLCPQIAAMTVSMYLYCHLDERVS